MSGYSGTPLAKKLGLKPGARVTFYSASAEVLAECQAALRECEETARGQVDFAMIFVTTRRQLESKFVLYSHRLKPDGTLWVSWPKKSSGVVSDVDENQVREVGLKTGLVDVKVCAVTSVWSGLKFVYRVKDRLKD